MNNFLIKKNKTKLKYKKENISYEKLKSSLFGKLNKNGLKKKGIKLLNNFILLLKKNIYNDKIKKNKLKYFLSLLVKITPLIQIKILKIAGINYNIPIPISEQKAEKMAIIFLFQALKNRKEYNFLLKLYFEILEIEQNKGLSFQKKIIMEKVAFDNRTFVFFLRK